MWLFLLVLIPAFFIYGILSFIFKLVTSKKDTSSEVVSRLTILKTIIDELKQELADHPDLTLTDQLKKYESEYEQLTRVGPQATDSFISPVPTPSASTNLFSSDISTIISNWYSDNSISALLYIGAFLIVASASIFVGYQWGAIAGFTKAYLIVIFTCLWFLFGSWFYTKPKIKSAGLTFLAIGALLIPFCGLGTYNFIFKDLGISLGYVWLSTSIASIVVYAALATTTKKQFFTYLLNLGSLSLVFSFINIAQLKSEVYILGSLGTALGLLCIRLLLVNFIGNHSSFYETPLETTANVLMPVSLIFGFQTVLFDNKLFTLETTLAILMGVVYYTLFYIHSQKKEYAGLAESLFIVFIWIGLKWQHATDITIFYWLSILSYLYIGLAFIFQRIHKEDTLDMTLKITLVNTGVWYVLSFMILKTAPHHLFFTLAASFIPLIQAVFFSKTKFRYLTNSLFCIAIYYLLIMNGTPLYFLPLGICVLAFIFYGWAHLFEVDSEEYLIYKTSAFASSFIICFVSWFYANFNPSISYPDNNTSVIDLWKLYTLITIYCAFTLSLIDTFLHNSSATRYGASASGMITYLATIWYLKVDELQIYSFPLGIYFLVLSYLKKRAGDEENHNILDIAGLFVLLFSSLWQSFGPHGAIYALFLGVEGIILVVCGNSFKYNRYIVAGSLTIALAVISQTYNYLFSLPRWLITGIGGLLFISVALYLLIYRKEHDSDIRYPL